MSARDEREGMVWKTISEYANGIHDPQDVVSMSQRLNKILDLVVGEVADRVVERARQETAQAWADAAHKVFGPKPEPDLEQVNMPHHPAQQTQGLPTCACGKNFATPAARDDHIIEMWRQRQ